MPIIICPRCRKRINVMPNIGDYVCNCSQSSASDTLKNDDILKLGNYEDFSGSGGNTNFNLGAENKSQGSIGNIEYNIKTHDLTNRGKIATLYRQRAHFEYIKIKCQK